VLEIIKGNQFDKYKNEGRKCFMMKRFSILFCLFSFGGMSALGQSTTARTNADSIIIQRIEVINRMMESAVIHKELTSLDTMYTEDFIFTHGSGNVQTKSQWLKSVGSGKAEYLSRNLDSIAVEPHGDVAVVLGRIIIHSQSASSDRRYGIRFVRVFVLRENRWLLLSHRTIAEWDIK
jgi:ketosteroid isomerase-like protein